MRVSGWSSGGGLRGGGDESDTNPKAAESKGNDCDGSPTSPATDEAEDGKDNLNHHQYNRTNHKSFCNLEMLVDELLFLGFVDEINVVIVFLFWPQRWVWYSFGCFVSLNCCPTPGGRLTFDFRA